MGLHIYKNPKLMLLMLPSLLLLASPIKIIGASNMAVNGRTVNTPHNEMYVNRLISFITSGYDLTRTFESTALAEKKILEPIANENATKLKASEVMHDVATPIHISNNAKYVAEYNRRDWFACLDCLREGSRRLTEGHVGQN